MFYRRNGWGREMGFPGGSVVKNLPSVQETRVWFLGQEDPLEEEMAIHSSILAWEIPGTEEPDGLQSTGLQKSWTHSNETTNTMMWQVITSMKALSSPPCWLQKLRRSSFRDSIIFSVLIFMFHLCLHFVSWSLVLMSFPLLRLFRLSLLFIPSLNFYSVFLILLTGQ